MLAVASSSIVSKAASSGYTIDLFKPVYFHIGGSIPCLGAAMTCWLGQPCIVAGFHGPPSSCMRSLTRLHVCDVLAAAAHSFKTAGPCLCRPTETLLAPLRVSCWHLPPQVSLWQTPPLSARSTGSAQGPSRVPTRPAAQALPLTAAAPAAATPPLSDAVVRALHPQPVLLLSATACSSGPYLTCHWACPTPC